MSPRAPLTPVTVLILAAGFDLSPAGLQLFFRLVISGVRVTTPRARPLPPRLETTSEWDPRRRPAVRRGPGR